MNSLRSVRRSSGGWHAADVAFLACCWTMASGGLLDPYREREVEDGEVRRTMQGKLEAGMKSPSAFVIAQPA